MHDTVKCLPHLFWCDCHFHSVKYFTNVWYPHFIFTVYSHTLIEQSPDCQTLYSIHLTSSQLEEGKSLVFDPSTHHRLHNISDPTMPSNGVTWIKLKCSLHTKEFIIDLAISVLQSGPIIYTFQLIVTVPGLGPTPLVKREQASSLAQYNSYLASEN